MFWNRTKLLFLASVTLYRCSLDLQNSDGAELDSNTMCSEGKTEKYLICYFPHANKRQHFYFQTTVVSAQMYFLFLNLEAVRAVGIPFKSALKRLVKQCVCVYLPLSPQTGCWAGFHLWTQCSTQTLVWSSVSPGKQWCSPHASASVDDGWSPSRIRVASWGCTFCSCRLLTENDEKKSQSQCWGW